ncbi:type II toxin-antitoxin system VapC family toxin (plasmid) [Skermanella mucosa]|uniref:type II toxin-antitoxin system VapC family toxin n=1 Tax=Skermanella mucosa TaxID=1789672 RepID=UPI00192BF929|nr:type II toxin-antitoxin system VapC family toxin [Skermanella mucosa]UEM25290.1 type II toxin-antitoxin system VapC family toxin [Skermanella mucosa]
MRLLLDTHALIWWLDDAPELSDRARPAIADRSNEILVSIASLWEIIIKRALGKLEFPEDLEKTISEEGFGLLAIGLPHLKTLETLPALHRDPFDRMLVAQALADGLVMVSGDPAVARYGAPMLW